MDIHVYIIGSGPHAVELKSYLNELGDHAIFVDREKVFVDQFGDKTTLDNCYIGLLQAYPAYIGSGNMKNRIIMRNMIKTIPGSIICKSAYVSPLSKIGGGSVIAPLAVVAANVEIDEYVLINYGVTVGHDVKIGSLSVVSPNASISGGCKIGKASYIGAGSLIRENLVIGSDVMIGMGAVVLKNVPDSSVVIGNPGRIYSKAEWNGSI